MPTKSSPRSPVSTSRKGIGPQPKLDRIDEMILRELQRDGRMTVAEIGERVGLSASPCARRIRLMEEAGIIKRYVAVLDRAKIGKSVKAFLLVHLVNNDQKSLDDFTHVADSIEQVIECYQVAGYADFMLRISATDMQDYGDMLASLTSRAAVARIDANFSLRATKIR